MASAIVAGFRLEEHYATRDAAVPELAAWAGLAAGYVAWRLTRGGPGALGASLP